MVTIWYKCELRSCYQMKGFSNNLLTWRTSRGFIRDSEKVWYSMGFPCRYPNGCTHPAWIQSWHWLLSTLTSNHLPPPNPYNHRHKHKWHVVLLPRRNLCRTFTFDRDDKPDFPIACRFYLILRIPSICLLWRCEVGRGSGWLLTVDHLVRRLSTVINGWCTTWWPTTEEVSEIQAGGSFGCPMCDKILRRIGWFNSVATGSSSGFWWWWGSWSLHQRSLQSFAKTWTFEHVTFGIVCKK